MDLNTSEFSASLFFGDVCITGSTSTPVHKDISGSNGKIAANKTMDMRKCKLIQTSDASSFEPPTKQMRLSNSFKIIAELKCTSTDSDVELVQNNVSVITIDDDDTLKCEKALIALDSKEFVNQETVEDGSAIDDSLTEKETIRSEESRESSRYETISETYCSDASELSNVSSINNIPLDDSVKLPKLTEESDSVVFVSETFPTGSIKGAKRMIIIDGSNVAFAHSSNRKEFSVEGIDICIDYFIKKGYDVKAVVPQMRLKRSNSTHSELLEQLKDEGKVIISPCKSLPNGKSLVSYDDRFILDLAHKFDGVVISNDNFRDLFDENEDYKRIIQSRIIGYMFCNDVILFPKDPYGRNGPTADEILTKKL